MGVGGYCVRHQAENSGRTQFVPWVIVQYAGFVVMMCLSLVGPCLLPKP